jgi:DNA-binding PadR family transcriptional regulator
MLRQVPARALATPLSVVVLGLLAEHPQLHPYAMRRLISERGHEQTVGRRGGSLYDAVRRLDGAGLIVAIASEREGRRPERTTYAITDAGRIAVREWLRDGLRDPERPESFRAAISFMYALDRDEAIGRLRERFERLDQTIAHAEAELSQAAERGVGEIFLSEERYAQHMRKAERDWLSGFTERLSNGSLRWPEPPAPSG